MEKCVQSATNAKYRNPEKTITRAFRGFRYYSYSTVAGGQSLMDLVN